MIESGIGPVSRKTFRQCVKNTQATALTGDPRKAQMTPGFWLVWSPTRGKDAEDFRFGLDDDTLVTMNFSWKTPAPIFALPIGSRISRH
jgi:hypothetical protein